MQVDVRDTASIPGLGRSPGGGHDNPLQYSCLENPLGQRNLGGTVHRVAKNRTWLKRLSMHTQTQGCRSALWESGQRLSPTLWVPLSPQLFPHNPAPLVSTCPHPIYPFRPWGWHSSDLQLHWPGFPECHNPAQARSWGSLRDIWSYITWGPSTYVCRWKPPGAQETDISALLDLRNLCYSVPKP